MIQQQTVTYSDGKQSYEGIMAYDDGIQGKRPVVLVSHAWMGASGFETEKVDSTS